MPGPQLAQFVQGYLIENVFLGHNNLLKLLFPQESSNTEATMKST
jgi:hypothetical protein